MNRGNGDSIKHAHQLIVALLKNSESDLTDILSSTNDQKPKTNQENDDETNKASRTNLSTKTSNNGKK